MIIPFVQYIRRELLFICYKVFGDISNKINRYSTLFTKKRERNIKLFKYLQ